MTSDRTVHAAYPDWEVVRYDRAGKWFLEPTRPMISCRRVTLNAAARAALEGVADGGVIYFGKPGGRMFDAKVRKLADA